MEFKLTIALDDRTDATLNKLAEAFGQRTTTPEVAAPAPAPAKANGAVGEPKKPQTAPSDNDKATPEKKAGKPKADESGAPKEPTNEEAQITVEEIRALAADVKAAKGSTKAVKDLLVKYEAANISGIPEDKLDAFAAELKRLL